MNSDEATPNRLDSGVRMLCAAASVYVNNIKKQATIKKEDSEDTDNEKDA